MLGLHVLSRWFRTGLRGSFAALALGAGAAAATGPLAVIGSPVSPADATFFSEPVATAQWNDPLLGQYSFAAPAAYWEEDCEYVDAAASGSVPITQSILRRVPPVHGSPNPYSAITAPPPGQANSNNGANWPNLAGQVVYPQLVAGDSSTPATPMPQQSLPPPGPSPVRFPAAPTAPTVRSPIPDPSAALGTLLPDQEILRGAEQKSNECVQRGISLAERGAVMAANAEFRQTLRLVAQSRDAAYGNRSYSTALLDGFQALKEAEDFVGRGRHADLDVDLSHIVQGHRTSVLKERDLSQMGTWEASAEYHAYARQRLTTACGNSPMASQAMFGMGKLEMAFSERSSSQDSLHTPKAIAFLQVALAIDPGNGRAANELGVVYARNAQWDEACRALCHSLSLKSQPETWKNLAYVYERMGQPDLATRAKHAFEQTQEARQAAAPQIAETPHGTVQWVDAATFQRVGGQVVSPPTTETPRVAERPVQPQQQPIGWR